MQKRLQMFVHGSYVGLAFSGCLGRAAAEMTQNERNWANANAASTPARDWRRRSTGIPFKGESVRKLSPASAPREWADLIAFVAVLATGILLIVFGHLTAGGLTTACAALVGVYGAWRHFR
jgi:hypothetical protein